MYSTKKRHYKESIVDSFYNVEIPEPISVTTLAGPGFDRIVNLAFTLNPIEINTYEIDETTYKLQLLQKRKRLEKEVADITNVYLKDINGCKITNFMDIDLMGTVLTQGNTIKNLLEQQSNLEGTKVFIGTFSIRLTGLDSTINYIKSLISLTLKNRVYINGKHTRESIGKLEYCQRYNTYFKGRISSFDLYHYSDKEGPMVTFRIVYT